MARRVQSAAHVSHHHLQEGKPSKAVRYQLAQSDMQVMSNLEQELGQRKAAKLHDDCTAQC